MMRFLHDFLSRRTRSAIQNRRRIFGLEPPPHIQRILEEEVPWGFGKTVALIVYLLFPSPRAILALAWLHWTDRDTPRKRRWIQSLAAELRPLLSPGARIVEGYFERRLYSRDLARVPKTLEKTLHRTTPLLAIQPQTEEDIRAILRFSSKHRLPLYPRGVASSAFGGAVPTMNGIVLDLSPMMAIREIDPDNRLVRVQPGVRWSDLMDRLRPFNICPVTTPTSLFSTVAGWASTGGLGIGGFGYGHFSDSVVGARVALPNGSLLELDAHDTRLRKFMGTEGQFGIFTELTVRVREINPFSKSCLYYFDRVETAFGFIDKLAERGHDPSHVVFYDHVRMHEENLMAREKIKNTGSIVEEKEAVLLHFDDPDQERRFREDVGLLEEKQSEDVAASVLWSDRYFPLKAQRIGPSMLACEVVLALDSVPIFISKAKKLARRYATSLAFEVFIARTTDRRNCVVIASFLCDETSPDYFLRLVFVQLLTNMGVHVGGRPYGFGIWNSPFLDRLFSKEERAQMVRFKKECDPQCLLNPQKFFSVRSRMHNIPGLLFVPQVYRMMLRFISLFSPTLGPIAKLLSSETGRCWQVPPMGEEDGARLIRETEARCTSCGACISVCPAFLVTGEELVTGRAKLRVAKVLATGGEITPEEASSTFQCLHCGLCEEVCQTGLPLRECYQVLEEISTRRYGRPETLIESFLQRVDESPSIVFGAYGLSHPAWSPQKARYRIQLGTREAAV